EEAVRRKAFARAAKAPVKAAPDLADQVRALLERRILSGLGLAKRAGLIISGFDKTAGAIRDGRAAWLIEAADGSADGRTKLLALAKHQSPPPRLFGVFSGEELSLALGGENVIHAALLAGRGADGWTHDVERLSGFRPLLPESWRGEP
ncbi:MAG: RNA-binding protein, partial [Caulobacteraceae bacterium]